MLFSDFLQLARSSSIAELQERLVAFAHDFQFATITAVLVVEKPVGPPAFRSIGNTPEGFLKAYTNVASSRRDPVLAALKRVSTPVLWDRRTYEEAGAHDLFEEQSAWGYRHGVAIATHLPNGQHLLVGVDRSDPLPNSDAELTRLVADLQLTLAYAQDAAIRLLGVEATPVGALTPREVEILKWTMEGKSTWEIGQILSISANTVKFHLKNVTAKLDCASKHTAAVKASRLGLLDPR